MCLYLKFPVASICDLPGVVNYLLCVFAFRVHTFEGCAFSFAVRYQLFGIDCGIHLLTLFSSTLKHIYSLDIKCLCIVVVYVIELYKLSFTYLLTYLITVTC